MAALRSPPHARWTPVPSSLFRFPGTNQAGWVLPGTRTQKCGTRNLTALERARDDRRRSFWFDVFAKHGVRLVERNRFNLSRVLI